MDAQAVSVSSRFETETERKLKVESREMEIKSLISSFVASMQPIIGRYRAMQGANVPEQFAIRVEAERERYKRKFVALRADPSGGGLAGVIDGVETTINELADSEIARAKADGKVEFTRQLADAVEQLKKRLNFITTGEI